MLVACWSPKGGVGTTVVATALALVLGRSSGESLLVDTAGDVPFVLGAGPAVGPGLSEWLAAAPDVPADALGRLEEPIADGVRLLRRGDGSLVGAAGADLLARLLAADPRPVVVDCGRIADVHGDGDVGMAIAAAADRSLLVLRPCAVGVHRASQAPVRAHGVVLVDEPGRCVGADLVASCVGVPVLGRVRVTEQVARAVDAGLLVSRMPRSLAADLRRVA